ncbi:MAG: hypothetical protein LEGION0398_MBIBDBAK_00208 [Legionellaceae bacterium]
MSSHEKIYLLRLNEAQWQEYQAISASSALLVDILKNKGTIENNEFHLIEKWTRLMKSANSYLIYQ